MSLGLVTAKIVSFHSIEVHLCLSVAFDADVHVLGEIDSLSSPLVAKVSSHLVLPTLVEYLQATRHHSCPADHHLLLRPLVSPVDLTVLRHLQRTGSDAVHPDSQFSHLSFRLCERLVESVDLFDFNSKLSRLHSELSFQLFPSEEIVSIQRTDLPLSELHDHNDPIDWPRSTAQRHSPLKRFHSLLSLPLFSVQFSLNRKKKTNKLFMKNRFPASL